MAAVKFGYVLDSWAVIAWLKNQNPAASRVRQLFEEAATGEFTLHMNIVNIGEVFYLAVKTRDRAYGQRVIEQLRARVASVPAPDDLVLQAASLKSRHPISYADAFAAATALRLDAHLVTGDPELKTLALRESRLKMEWLGV